MKKIPACGIMLLISVSPLFRGLYFSYDTYVFLAGLSLLSALYFLTKSLKNERIAFSKPVLIFEALLVCGAALSFTNALNPRENTDTLVLYLVLLAVSTVLYDFFHNDKQLFIKWLMIPGISVGFVSAAVGLTALSGHRIWEVTVFAGRIGSTFQYANTAAVYYVICLLFALTLSDVMESILIKALFSGMGSVLAFALLMTGSRGGYLTAVGVIITMFFLFPHRHRLRNGFGLICMLAPIFAAIGGFNRSAAAGDLKGTVLWLGIMFFTAAAASLIINIVFRLLIRDREYVSPKGTGYVFAAVAAVIFALAAVFRERLLQLVPPYLFKRVANLVAMGFNERNVLYRIAFDKDALKLLPGHWLTGIGGGGWKGIYQSVQDFFYTAAFVHNNYLQVFVESGILGFVAFTALVVISLWYGFRSVAKAASPGLRACCAGLVCALLALVIHSAGDFDLSFISLLLLLWVMFTASAVNMPVKRREADDAAGAKKPGVLPGFFFPGGYSATAITVACSVLMTVSALHFAAARYAQIAFDFGQEKDYRSSLAYYEEASRLDAANTKYSFELAKLYRYFANRSNETGTRSAWLEKARTAAEKSIAGYRYYPPYMNTLVRIQLDSNMPLEALKTSRQLIACQRYYAENYELLAASCLAAADYYIGKGDVENAKMALAECIRIGDDPSLRRSVVDMPNMINSVEVLARYSHSSKLSKYLNEADAKLVELDLRK